jgi:hypothetical protein
MFFLMILKRFISIQKSSFVIAFAFLMLSCSGEDSRYKPEDYFTSGQMEAIKLQLVLKTCKKPDGTPSMAEIKAYYEEEAKTYQWHFTHETNKGFYFLISRPAPSLFGKRLAIGGFFLSPDHLQIHRFKEIFQTIKMKPDELVQRGSVLFEKMVNGQDLKPYYLSRAKEKQGWIELPDDVHYYDSTSLTWKTRMESAQ